MPDLPVITPAERRLRRLAQERLAFLKPVSPYLQAARDVLGGQQLRALGRGAGPLVAAGLRGYERYVGAPAAFFSPVSVTAPLGPPVPSGPAQFAPGAPFTAVGPERVFGQRQVEPVGRFPTLEEMQAAAAQQTGLNRLAAAFVGPESLIPGFGFVPARAVPAAARGAVRAARAVPGAVARGAQEAVRAEAGALPRMAPQARAMGRLRGEGAQEIRQLDAQVKQVAAARNAAAKAGAPVRELDDTLEAMRLTRRNLLESYLPSEDWQRLGELETELEEARVTLEVARQRVGPRAPHFGTPERAEYDNLRRLASEAGRPVLSKARQMREATSRLKALEDEYREITALEPDEVPIVMAPRTAAQVSLPGVGPKQVQAEMLAEFQGKGVSAQQMAAEEQARLVEAQRLKPLPGQAALPEAARLEAEADRLVPEALGLGISPREHMQELRRGLAEGTLTPEGKSRLRGLELELGETPSVGPKPTVAPRPSVLEPAAVAPEGFGVFTSVGEAVNRWKAKGSPKGVYLRWETRVPSMGERLPPSRQYREGELTGKVLRGTSVIDPQFPFSRHTLSTSYEGNLYLVRGKRLRRGQDPGEVFLEEAVIEAPLEALEPAIAPEVLARPSVAAGIPPSEAAGAVPPPSAPAGPPLPAAAEVPPQGPPSAPPGTLPPVGAGVVPPAGGDPLGKLTGLLRAAKPVRRETEVLKHEARQRQAAMLARAQEVAQGEQEFQRAKGLLKGELPQATFTPPAETLSQGERDALFQQLAASPLRPFEKVAAGDALESVIQGRLPTLGQIELLERIFGPDFSRALLTNQPWTTKLADAIEETLSLPKSLAFGFDLSFTLRQGGYFAVGENKVWRAGFAAQIKALRSKALVEALERQREAHRFYAIAMDAGLDLTRVSEKTAFQLRREEQFIGSRILRKIPVLGKGVELSERAYGAGANEMRWAAFREWAEAAEATGIPLTENQEKALAKLINAATGRGSLFGLERSPEMSRLLRVVFTSARFATSRFETIPRVMYAAAVTPQLRVRLLTGLVKWMGARVTLLTLLGASGLARVELDPRSSDWGKMVVAGKVRYDPWSGFQQVARFLAQEVSGQRKPLTGKGMTRPGRGNILFQFGRSKLAPWPGGVVTAVVGKDFTGQRISPLRRVSEATLEPFLNVGFQDFWEASQQMGVWPGAALATPVLLGAGAQFFDPFESALARLGSRAAAGRRGSLEGLQKLYRRATPSTSPRAPAGRNIEDLQKLYRKPVPAGAR